MVDTCGNASEPSKWHKPFLLQSSLGLNDVINLNWQPYLIDGSEMSAPGVHIFKSIAIFRGTSPAILGQIGTVTAGIGSTSYIDTDPPAGVKVYYRIGGEKDPPCNPNNLPLKKASAGPFVHSFSNLEDNRRGTFINENANDLKVYPNPMNNYVKIFWNNSDPGGTSLLIYNIPGSVVKRIDNIYWREYTMERGDLQPGYYILELRGRDLMRTRLVVQ